MFYIILLIAGVALAANRKQQAATSADIPVSVAQSNTTILPHFLDIALPNFRRDFPSGPGIGAPLSANNPGVSNIIVSGPNIYRPGGPAGAPAASAPGGGGTSGGTTPSGTGGGGLPPGVPTGPHFPNTL